MSALELFTTKAQGQEPVWGWLRSTASCDNTALSTTARRGTTVTVYLPTATALHGG